MANPLRTLHEYGQSVWLDFVSRDLLKSGGLTKLIADDGLRGVTSNPSIFEKAIGHGDDYDAQIATLQASGDLDPGALFERLAVTDIQHGADALRPIYHQTEGRDGYISIEVSPYLAMDTGGTIEEARRLWREVARENLMIKIPGTKPGLPAIRAMIAEGVNINVTLLFSQQVYADVVEAYISGLEAFAKKGGDPHRVASVASFFGPVMATWFVVLAVTGLLHISDDPGVLLAINPYYAIWFVANHGTIGLVTLGAVFLAVTGGEALYADLGHFGRKPIRMAWFGLVLPSLVINYFGQGALVLANPATIENPFFRLFPDTLLIPTVVLATAHPAKFPDAVERAIGIRPALPPRLADLYDREERYDVLANDAQALKALIERGKEQRAA